MTPHHLAATAAAWSLHQAYGTLTARATAEALQRGETLIAAGPVPSRWYGTRRSVGSHADPVSATLTLDRPAPRGESWVELLRRLDRKLAWCADMVYASPPDAAPLDRILSEIPGLLPATARLVALHLADEDRWVRALPGDWPANREPLPGVDCPHCGERQLMVQCAGPVEVWTVVCATGRPCVGPGCGCGMAGAAEGAPHIWRRADVIGAVAGAAPNQARTN